MSFAALERRFNNDANKTRFDPKIRYYGEDGTINCSNFFLFVIIPIGLMIGRWLGREVVTVTIVLIVLDALGVVDAVILYLCRIYGDRRTLRVKKDYHQSCSTLSIFLSVIVILVMAFLDIEAYYGSTVAVKMQAFIKEESQLAKNLTLHIHEKEGLEFANKLREHLTSQIKDELMADLRVDIFIGTKLDEELTTYKSLKTEDLTKELNNYVNTNGADKLNLLQELNEYLDSKERSEFAEELVRCINENQVLKFVAKLLVLVFSLLHCVCAMSQNVCLVEKLARQDQLKEQMQDMEMQTNTNRQPLINRCPFCRSPVNNTNGPRMVFCPYCRGVL